REPRGERGRGGRSRRSGRGLAGSRVTVSGSQCAGVGVVRAGGAARIAGGPRFSDAARVAGRARILGVIRTICGAWIGGFPPGLAGYAGAWVVAVSGRKLSGSDPRFGGDGVEQVEVGGGAVLVHPGVTGEGAALLAVPGAGADAGVRGQGLVGRQ